MPNFSSDPEAYSPNVPPPMRAQQQARIDAAFNEMNSQDREAAEAAKREMDLMTEARTRFAKAALYEQIIEGQLFEGDDSVTLEVEDEFKSFAEERLRVLLGIHTDSKSRIVGQLEEEELNVLKLFAAKLLGRQASIPRPAAPEAPKPVMVPRAAPVAPPTGQLAAPKRGRGRPPGTGKHQRAAVASQPLQHPLGHGNSIFPPRVDPTAIPTDTRQVVLPNGQIKEISIQKGDRLPGVPPQIVTQNATTAASTAKPLPMPSPDEMIADAARVGENGLRKAENSMRNPNLE